jgi:hypothetical protein
MCRPKHYITVLLSTIEVGLTSEIVEGFWTVDRAPSQLSTSLLGLAPAAQIPEAVAGALLQSSQKANPTKEGRHSYSPNFLQSYTPNTKQGILQGILQRILQRILLCVDPECCSFTACIKVLLLASAVAYLPNNIKGSTLQIASPPIPLTPSM